MSDRALDRDSGRLFWIPPLHCLMPPSDAAARRLPFRRPDASGAKPMKIRTHAQMFVAAVGLAALLGSSAPAPAATFDLEQAAIPESVATPTVTQAAADGPLVPKICCFRWICWVC
jgi:hypothetical protein